MLVVDWLSGITLVSSMKLLYARPG